MNKILLCGDVHGKVEQYYKLVSKARYSVQLGDFCTSPNGYKILDHLSPDRHKIVFGNHDYYPVLHTLQHSLGDFGVFTLNGVEFFFVRGSISIDRKVRLMMEVDASTKTWFAEEELNTRQMDRCITEYEKAKPSIVLTHDCPLVAKDKLGGSGAILAYYGFPPDFACSTQKLLQALWDIHQPKLWCLGHWHRDREFKVGNTQFVILNELSCVDIYEDCTFVRKS